MVNNNLDKWGYFINGVSIILGTGQVLAGGGIVSASIFTGNIVGVIAGASLVLHGLNNIQESAFNIINNRDNTSGFLRDAYSATAEFLGFEAKTGSIAFSSVDLMLSGYGLGRMVLKPDAWRLFRFIPTDYIRSIKTMGAPALAIEALGDGLTIKSIYEKS